MLVGDFMDVDYVAVLSDIFGEGLGVGLALGILFGFLLVYLLIEFLTVIKPAIDKFIDKNKHKYLRLDKPLLFDEISLEFGERDAGKKKFMSMLHLDPNDIENYDYEKAGESGVSDNSNKC